MKGKTTSPAFLVWPISSHVILLFTHACETNLSLPIQIKRKRSESDLEELNKQV